MRIYACLTLVLYNSTNMPSCGQNLVSNENLDLQLPNDIKNSLLSCIALPIEVTKVAITANLNEKNLATNSTWDFDANFETSDPS